MERTVCELFAGVGGFRCGLNGIKRIADTKKPEKWTTVWFSQWEPGRIRQWAHDCYVNHFGSCEDKKVGRLTNTDIATVPKSDLPDHNLLVGGFPCQDYSVAHSLSGEKGIEGKKGVLWWSIRDVLAAKRPPFVLLENVDRLLKSPSKQRGRDFGIILACFQELGYVVEWRVINAADYGCAQRRRRTFIFAAHSHTTYARRLHEASTEKMLTQEGFFATCFKVKKAGVKISAVPLPSDIVEVSNTFAFPFENAGLMRNGEVFTAKTEPVRKTPVTLGAILQRNAPDGYIPEAQLYYTDPTVRCFDETAANGGDLVRAQRTWQYLKGGKKKLRTKPNGEPYVFSEGAIPMIDEWDFPARTMLTSESSFNRSTHIVRDPGNNRIRLLTPIEAERIQSFPDDWTKECRDSKTGQLVPMPPKMRYFCMGNALVVKLIAIMEKKLAEIFDAE